MEEGDGGVGAGGALAGEGAEAVAEVGEVICLTYPPHELCVAPLNLLDNAWNVRKCQIACI